MGAEAGLLPVETLKLALEDTSWLDGDTTPNHLIENITRGIEEWCERVEGLEHD